MGRREGLAAQDHRARERLREEHGLQTAGAGAQQQADVLSDGLRLVGGLGLDRLPGPVQTGLGSHRLEDQHQARDSHKKIGGRGEQDRVHRGAPDDL